MKVRNFWVTKYRTESGLYDCGISSSVTRSWDIGRVRMSPTVANIRKYIAETFPEEKIEETWSSVKEQISDGLPYGMISISFKKHPNEEYYSHSVTFMEL